MIYKYLTRDDLKSFINREFFTFTDFSKEIKTDGSESVSKLLSECLEEHDNVFLPKGKYYIPKTVTLKSNQSVVGEEGSKIVCDGGAVFAVSGRYDAENDEVEFVHDIAVRNFDIKSTRLSGGAAVVLSGFSDALVDNLTVDGMGVCKTHTERPGFGRLEGEESFRKYQSHDFIISNCRGNAHVTTTDGMISGITIHDSRDFVIRDCVLEYYGHGIMFWGGDASTKGTIPGRASFSGKVANGLFLNNTINEIQWGGLWGTFGNHLTIKDCRITNCRDVGVDMEGCRNSIVTGNYFENCIYNFGAPDQFAGNITFSYNTSVHAGDNNRLQHFDGHTSWDCEVAYDWQKIYIEHNKFITKGKIGIVAATYFCRGPVLGHLFVRNNEFINTVFSSVSYPESVEWPDAVDKTYQLDLWETVVEGNSFYFDFEKENPFRPDYLHKYYHGAINIIANNTTEGAPCIVSVRNNRVDAKLGFACGIHLEHGKTARDYEAVCMDNEISSAYRDGIVIENETDNAFSLRIEGNTADSVAVKGRNINISEKDNKTNKGEEVLVK